MSQDPFAVAMDRIRRKLTPPQPRERPLLAVAAAALFALSALVFAAAAVLAPANVTTPMDRVAPR